MFGDTQRSVFLLKKNQAFWPHSQTHTDLLSNPVSKSDLHFSAIRNVRFFSSKKVKAAGLIAKHIQSCLTILFRNLTLAQTTTQREKNTFVLLEIFGQTDRQTDRRTDRRMGAGSPVKLGENNRLLWDQCLGMRPAALTFFDEKNRTLRIAENCRLDFETGLERRSVCVWEWGQKAWFVLRRKTERCVSPNIANWAKSDFQFVPGRCRKAPTRFEETRKDMNSKYFCRWKWERPYQLLLIGTQLQ